MAEVQTGGGASVQGDANTGGGDLAGRDKTVTSGNVVNVNLPGISTEMLHPEAYNRILMPSVEQEFRTDIKALTVAVTKLEVIIGQNNEITREQVKVVKEQVAVIKEQVTAVDSQVKGLARLNLIEPERKLPYWTGYATLVLLTVIAGCMIYGVLVLTHGGF